MKFIVSLSLLLLCFSADANSSSEFTQNNKSLLPSAIYKLDDRGKNNRKINRIKKRRKRKCKQFGRRIYAG